MKGQGDDRNRTVASLMRPVPAGRCDQGSKPSLAVGGIFSITGPASYLGEPERNPSMEMVAEEINAKGGINGHPVKLVIYDDEGDVTKARLARRKAAQKDKALAIIGPSLTHTSMTVLEITQKAKVPLISCAAAAGHHLPGQGAQLGLQDRPDRPDGGGPHLTSTCRNRALPRWPSSPCPPAFGVAGKEQLLAQAPKFGIEVVAQEVFGEKDTDMTPQLTKIRGAGAQAVICWGTGPAPALVAKNMKQLGLTMPLIQSHGAASKKFIELAGDAAEGIIMPAGKLVIYQQLPDSDPQKAVCQDYAEKYQAKFKAPRTPASAAMPMTPMRMLNNGPGKGRHRPGKDPGRPGRHQKLTWASAASST